MRFELPFVTDVPVKSYLHHAYPFGIICGNGCEDYAAQFVAANYAQLVWAPESQKLNFYVLFFPYWSCFERKWDQVFVQQENMIETVIRELSDHYYVYLICDEYYIKCRECYQKEHFFHDILIYGYDDDKKVFLTAGFDAKRKYQTDEIPFGEIVLYDAQYIESLRFISSAPLPEKPDVKAQIRSYLTPDHKAEDGKNYLTGERSYGAEALEALKGYLNMLMTEGGKINIIPFYVYHERLSLIEKMLPAHSVPEDIQCEWAYLCNAMKSVKLAALKYEKYANRQDLCELTVLFRQCVDTEAALLRRIADTL